MKRTGSTSGPPTEALLNLARYHREHEKYYAIAPLRDAEVIPRASRTLKALADRWSRAEALLSDQARPAFSGCEDLNDTTAIETSGVLFMEGAGEPAELIRLKQDLRARAEGSQQTGSWLAEAMGTSWESAGAIAAYPAPGGPARARGIASSSITRLAASMSQLHGHPGTPGGGHPRRRRFHPGRGARRPDRSAHQPRLPVLRGGAARPGRRPGGDIDDADPRQRTRVAGMAARVETVRDADVAPGPAEP